jgi:hypothetical protein
LAFEIKKATFEDHHVCEDWRFGKRFLFEIHKVFYVYRDSDKAEIGR